MPYKVLVVDDERTVVQLIKFILEEKGYEVLTANNGREAFDCVRNIMPHLIIMDYKMPIMNGWDATKKIRSLPGFESIPILGLTGYASEENVIKGMEYGITEVVKKPFDIEKLLNLIQNHLT